MNKLELTTDTADYSVLLKFNEARSKTHILAINRSAEEGARLTEIEWKDVTFLNRIRACLLTWLGHGGPLANYDITVCEVADSLSATYDFSAYKISIYGDINTHSLGRDMHQVFSNACRIANKAFMKAGLEGGALFQAISFKRRDSVDCYHETTVVRAAFRIDLFWNPAINPEIYKEAAREYNPQVPYEFIVDFEGRRPPYCFIGSTFAYWLRDLEAERTGT